MKNKEEINSKEGECPFGFSTQEKRKTVRHSNKNWWPNQLNLKILHQNSSLTSPFNNEFNYAEEFKSLDLNSARCSTKLD